MPDPALIIATVTVPVNADSVQLDVRARGQVVETMDGSLRSSVDPASVRLEVRGETIPMTAADVAALRAAAPHGQPAAVSGRLFGADGETSPGAPLTCDVLWGPRTPVKVKPLGIRWVQAFTLRQQ